MVDPLTGDTASQRIEAALANIQPLRDLARNWDVDIASYLEEYLHDIVGHLEDERNDLDEPEGPPNFAQAALLLQNSSNVYSRKVEYLYSLVYAALDDLASSTTGGIPKHQRKTADASIDEFNAFDPDMQFLLLDDVLPTDQTEAGEKINLDDDEDNEYNVDHTRLNTTRLSLGGMSVTRADRSFGNVNEARSIIGFLFQQGDDAGGGSLKLLNGRCDVGDEGILVMPGTALPGSQNSRFDVNSSPAPADNDDGGMTYDDDQDDGVGFQLADDRDPTEGFGAAADEDPPVVQHAQKAETKKNDPWALLDPHDMGPTKARRLRIGVTYRLPEGLDDPPSNAVTGAHTRRRTLPTRKPVDRAAPTVVSIATETFRATVANRRQQRTTAAMTSLDEKDSIEQDDSMNDSSMFHNAVARPRVPITGLAFGEEFAYIAKAAAKRKAAERRERRKLLAQDPQAIEESSNLFGYDDFDSGENDSIGGNYDDNVGNTGIASLDAVHATPDAKEASNLEAIEFEALCRAHIKSFAKGAEKYAAETNLTKRVGEWQSKLAPILEEEERRPEFNIHDYGDRVIEIMTRVIEKKKHSKQKDSVVSFQQVTRNCERYDVCRLFLASLNLTSAGNVAFASGSEPDSLNFKLLNSRVDHPMENYMAPSATVQ